MSATVETGTFSSVIDDVRMRSGRTDRTADIMAYARSSMRECTVLAEFSQSSIEGTFTVDTLPFILTRPDNFRKWEALQYPYFTRRGKPIYAVERRPGKEQNTDNDYWFYRSGNSFVFNGLAVGDIVKYAFQAYLPRLAYYANDADKPAIFDLETNLWTYHADYTGNDTLNQAGQDKVTNWLLFNWYDLVLEGTLAKLYKTVGDERQRASYALYKQQQKDLMQGEGSTI